jgi:hypothetical protein
MLIFNGMLIVFSGFFPAESTTFGASASDPSENQGGYMNIGTQSVFGDMILTGGGIFAGSIILAAVTHSIVWIGAGSFIAFIASLWVGVSKPITGIIGYFSVSGMSLYGLFVICLGIVITASVIEMFVQQRGAG